MKISLTAGVFLGKSSQVTAIYFSPPQSISQIKCSSEKLIQGMDCCEDSASMRPVVCPKPRRAAPFKSQIRNDAASKAGAELLSQILRKDKFEAEKCATLSSSPPFCFGSPPCRTLNPVVQDAHFGVEKLSFITERPAHAREQLGEKQAPIRVEGFHCF